MREHAVGRQALVHLAEVRPLAQALAGARDAGLRVDDDVAGDHVRGHERRERQHGRRRVAAGAGDEPRGLQRGRGPLGHAVGRALGQRRHRVIPAAARGAVAQAEGARRGRTRAGRARAGPVRPRRRRLQAARGTRPRTRQADPGRRAESRRSRGPPGRESSGRRRLSATPWPSSGGPADAGPAGGRAPAPNIPWRQPPRRSACRVSSMLPRFYAAERITIRQWADQIKGSCVNSLVDLLRGLHTERILILLAA